MLRRLNLRSNSFNGTIPSALFRCTLLRSVFLQQNLFSGDISPEISNLTDLYAFNAAGNRLSGKFPGVLPGNIRFLDLSSNSINLSYNRISGEIPASLGELQNLQYLWLDFNSLGGTLPSALANCSALVHFSAEGNSIGGVVPAAIGGLPRLQVISLSHNNLSGGLPVSVTCNNSAMQVLDLQRNRISCGFPFFLTNVSSLTSLDLSGNLLSDSIPSEIGNLQHLEELRLANNSFSGLVPSEIRNCRSIRILDLDGNLFSGLIPAFVIELINLKVLSLGGNNFSGPIPSGFENLTSLESLILSGNRLTGGLPEEFLVLSNLSTLDLSGNKFNGSIPTSIGNLKQLTVLNLSSNGLSGIIPTSLGSLFKLTSLDLSKQNMSGPLPSNLVGLPNLQVIALQENMFSGEVPEELGNCSSLGVLDLRSNALSGKIPVDFSRLSGLRVLDLGKNNLTGQIPKEISNCLSLTSLSLDSNHLTGFIPANLSLISTLVDLNLSNNNLVGEVPVNVGSRFNNQSSFAGNPGLCGKPLHRKCGENGDKNRLIMFVAVAASGTLLMLSCCCFYIYSFLRWREKVQKDATGEKKKQSPARASSRTSGGRGSSEHGGPPKLVMFNDKITLAETVEATRLFDEENVLSRTRHGVLFKACYNDGMVLAIRRLPDGGSLLDLNAFRKEAESLGGVKHRNLTVLRGYYVGSRPDTRLLVYDYMPNGNLATLLQEASHQDGHVLNWPMRHLIALGIARGLAFLHTASMVHGDVKPQNVLFDADFETHLSDFGLDKLTASAEASTSATSVGTIGYVAPEATLTHEMTRESDVYSFGIVLLELLTGKRPVMFTGDEDIVKWVKKQLQRGQVSELLEPGLMELDPESSEWEEFLLGIKVGLLCTAPDPLDRPTMTDIMFMLEGCRVGPDIPSSADPTSQPSPA
ncbi:probable LRR receptor-like serine/threonine-protein kinase at4g36180 [Phtheirospermum japonicum]|uniref:Probable LRR receptor-like serine/threonine-protein kinase at4g36180 n=1 Tax=Phtheirospermum japonicum TaxID=374723 RepID=A0A830CI99_9LAMI|nr:probable LRR receptor-like serine/threonine-protein kinase at4g36180 [Phtheirospermum japonicum]